MNKLYHVKVDLKKKTLEDLHTNDKRRLNE